MPAAVQISVVDDATPQVLGLMERMRSDDLKEIAGQAAANTTRDWLRSLNNRRPNALGGTRTNFYSKAAAATGSAPTADGAVVYTNQTGVLYQRYGGTIRPSGRISSVTGKRITRLALPAATEAHGRVPADFNDLSVFVFKSHGLLKVGLEQNVSQAVSFGKRRKDGSRKVKQGEVKGGRIMFWLVLSASKGPDTEVLPPTDLVQDAVSFAVIDFVLRNARRLVA